MIYKYLSDAPFLAEFDKIRVKEQYVKITALHFMTEKELESIEGKVIGGSLNISGDSPVRRTGSLSLIADETTTHPTDLNSIISLNKKIKIEIGFINNSLYYKEYETLWFPLGTFVITDSSLSHSGDGVSISVNFSDKMCLLNGDVGGKLPASIDFMDLEYVDDNGLVQTYAPTVYQTIVELVNHFGKEQLGKIIIDGLSETAPKLSLWNNKDKDVYFEKTVSDEEVKWLAHKIEVGAAAPTGENILGPYTFGDLVGLEYTEFTFPAESLTTNPGESICDVLTRISNAFGNTFEYYYDVYGNFHFSEIKNYLNTTQASYVIDALQQEDYLIDRAQTKSVYSFEDNSLVTSISNSPQMSMIKNDFVIWGNKKVGDDYEAIRYHLAIAERPIPGEQHENILLDKEANILGCPIKVNNIDEVDKDKIAPDYYYMDKDGKIYKFVEGNPVIQTDVFSETIKSNDYRTELYLKGLTLTPVGGGYLTNEDDFYAELADNWDKMFHLVKKEGNDYYEDEWNEGLNEEPYGLLYFLDLIDTGAAISRFSIDSIGKRTYVESADNSGCNCIFEPNEPDFYFVKNDDDISKDYLLRRGHSFLILSEEKENPLDTEIYESDLSLSTKVSAFETAKSLLYQYTGYNEAINISCIPIYYLEPNTRITVRDTDSDVYGDYIINSITLPLSVSEEMSITATRALQKL